MRRTLIGLAVLLALITGGKALLNQFTDGVNDIFPSFSIEESRKAGVYVCSMTATPSHVSVDGQDFAISAAWIEKDYRRRHHWVWIPYRQIFPTYRLCITPSVGAAAFLPSTGLIMALSPQWKRSFATVYPRLFFVPIEVASSSITVYILHTDKRGEVIPLSLERSNQAMERTADRCALHF